jgi:ribosomal protein S18 acetylase RimI-like enzyme
MNDKAPKSRQKESDQTNPLEVRRADALDSIREAAHLFDRKLNPVAAERFLASEGHHLLLAYEAASPVGFVSGVEMTHPDKGTEMFLYELGVAETHRGQGIGTSLVRALRDLAEVRGCYGMWVLTDQANAAALAAYANAGGKRGDAQAMLSWVFPSEKSSSSVVE